MAKFSWLSFLIVVSIMASQYLLSAAFWPGAIEPGITNHPYTRKVAYALRHPNMPCRWKVYVKTGDRNRAGTDAVVSLKIYDRSGDNITVSNLEKHGIRPATIAAQHSVSGATWTIADANYNFFESGQKDEFEFYDRCLGSNICKVVLSHNNGGSRLGWFVDYIIAHDGPNPNFINPHRFDFNRWLDRNSGLSATVDLCPS